MRQLGYDVELEDDTLYPQRTPTTVRRYQPVETRDAQQQHAVTHPRQQQVRRPNQYDNVNVYVRRRSAQQAAPRTSQTPPTQAAPRPPRSKEQQYEREDEERATEPLRPRRRMFPFHFHWLMWVGLGMVAMLVLWIGGSIGLNWWYGYQDDLHYGRPRTYQCDATVGHHDAQTPSHFLALNLNRHVEVIEFPGGDATKAKVYTGPILVGDNADSDIVTVSFKDVNGDGKPDLIMSVNAIKYVYLNDNGAFRPLRADEPVTV